MKTHLLRLSFILAVAASVIVSTSYAQAVNTTDSLALVDLYNSTNGANWNNHQNWLNGPVSTWFGVVVTGSRVTYLNLAFNNMIGPLPASIGNLTELTNLFLIDDGLTGNIPSSIGNLTKLTMLEFPINQLSGSIPSSIGNLKELTYLDLSVNLLSGSIPSSIGNLNQVIYLFLEFNQLSGSIPSSIGNLQNALELWLYNNQLSGSIPSSIGNLKKLYSLVLENNQLTGPIPPSIGKLTALTSIVLSNNMLSGKIPTSLGNLDLLTILSLDHNQLTGSVPAALMEADKLAVLYLEGNQLSEDENYNFSISKQPLQGDIENNHFTFNSLEMIATKFPKIVYYPQAPVAIHKNGNILAVSAGGTLSNNTYKWFRVGNVTPTIIVGDSTFSPATAGDYYAQITNAVATKLTLTTDTVSYSPSFAATQKPGIYPNPVKNILTVSGLNAKLITTISIADISGNIWLRKTVNKQETIQYNVSSLKAGNYVLYISGEGRENALHFVKE